MEDAASFSPFGRKSALKRAKSVQLRLKV